MTNFDFLKSTPDFASFADVAISADNQKDILRLETILVLMQILLSDNI